MITERDLKEAIAECQGVRNPNASTCLKLASYLTIKKELFEKEDERNDYSYASAPIQEVEDMITYVGDTEFAKAIHGREPNEIWSIVEEAMSAIQVLNPPLYKSIMRRIEY